MTLSLIIPTYNRPMYLRRLLAYYRRSALCHAIAVADSSRDPEAQENREAVDASNPLQATYVKFAETTNPYEKIAATLERLQTPFAAVCADDDYIVPSALDECVAFLERHGDYSIAHGRAVVLTIDEDHAPGDRFRGIATRTYRQCSIDAARPEDRLRAHLSDYTTTFYSVHRRAQLARNMRLAGERTSDYRFGELLGSALSLVQGKAHAVDRLYAVRTDNVQRASLTLATSLMMPWAKLLVEDDYSDRYRRFRDTLAEELVATGGSSQASAREAVDEAFVAFLATRLDTTRYGLDGLRASLERLAELAGRAARLAVAAVRSHRSVGMLRDPQRTLRELRDEIDPQSVANLLSADGAFRGIYESVTGAG